MYLIDCPCCRVRITDEARICSMCGYYLGYRRAVIADAPRYEPAQVQSGETSWRAR